MNAIETILTRRSIRKFLDRKVSVEDVQTLLRAGMFAPSANNEQPWRFVVIDERDLLDKIPEFHPWSKMLLEAPLAILVCAFVPVGKKFDMWVQDCSAATQNILLAAHHLGLGGVWLAVHPREERITGARALCGLPDEIYPFSIIALGYPAEHPQAVDRFDPDKVHYNHW